MSKVPVPPKRSYKNRVASQQAPEISSRPASGSGFNVAKSLQDTAFDFDVMGSRPPRNMAPKVSQQVKPRPNDNHDSPSQQEPEFFPTLHDILDEAPDVIIGEDVEIKGDFQFDGLLHLYGRFEGRLLSDGDVYMGPKAVLKSNVQHIRRLIIDGGHVIGQISVQQLGIAGAAFVRGDISCKYIEVNSDDCTILGKLYVHPQAPEVVEFPRERLTPKEDIDISRPIIMKPIEQLSPMKETLEVSVQVIDPDEILTPAELALRAKLEAKERRKEAKRQQQEEALRQSHGLVPLSPENKKELQNEQLLESPSSSPLPTTKSLSSIQEPQLVDPKSVAEESNNENNQDEGNSDSPIKLVSGAIGETENDHDSSDSNREQKLSTIDQWSTPSAAEDLSSQDDIQKTIESVVSTEATAPQIHSKQEPLEEETLPQNNSHSSQEIVESSVSTEDTEPASTVSDTSAEPVNEADESSSEPAQLHHASPEKAISSLNLSPTKEGIHDSEVSQPGLILPPSPEQRAELLAQEEQDAKCNDAEPTDGNDCDNNSAPLTNETLEEDQVSQQSPEKEQNEEKNMPENNDATPENNEGQTEE